MNRRKRDPELTISTILDTAEQLFLEKGFSNVSLSQLAISAGVTKSLIHHHFGSKDALWTAVKRRFFADYADAQRRLLQDSEPSLELLTHSLIAYFNYLKARPNFARMNSMMMLEGDTSCQDIFSEIIDMGTQAIRAAQENGEIRSDVSADTVLITGLNLVESWFVGRERFMACHYRHLDEEVQASTVIDELHLREAMAIFMGGIIPPG